MVAASFAEAMHELGIDVDHPDKLESTAAANT
jgi:hypothetical protein